MNKEFSRSPHRNNSVVFFDLDNDYEIKKGVAKLFSDVCRRYEEHDPHILPMVKSKKKILINNNKKGKVEKVHFHLISYCFNKVRNKDRAILKQKNKEVYDLFLEIERKYPGNIILGSRDEIFRSAKKRMFSK